MPSAQKTERVSALKARIEGANALLLAEYRGLSVHDATELRRSLSEQARLSVVKNTLFQRAAGDAGIEDIESILSGPTAVAFVHGDVVTAAKKVVEAAKKFPALVLKGAYMDGKILDAATAQALASLESREVTLSKIAGMMKAEMVRAASMFQALQGRFLGALDAYKAKLPGEEQVEAVAEPVAEPKTEASLQPEAEAEPPEPEAVAEAEPDAEASAEPEPQMPTVEADEQPETNEQEEE